MSTASLFRVTLLAVLSCAAAVSPLLSSNPPQPMLVLPVEVTQVIDGDTCQVEVRLIVRVRLLDCWSPERREQGGPQATQRLRELAEGKTGVLEIPIGGARRLDDVLTFGRVLGNVWIDGRSVGQVLVEEGKATFAKPKR